MGSLGRSKCMCKLSGRIDSRVIIIHTIAGRAGHACMKQGVMAFMHAFAASRYSIYIYI